MFVHFVIRTDIITATFMQSTWNIVKLVFNILYI